MSMPVSPRMRLPTPPDDKSQRPGYSTPPAAAADLLTPELTPHKTHRTADARATDRTGSPLRNATNIRGNMMTTDEATVDGASRECDTAHAGSQTDIDIPHHMQGDDGSRTSPSQHDASPLRVRKKRKQRLPSASAPFSTSKTDDWGDLPADMITNDHLYDQIRRKKMDRLEALEDGSAIEAVVVLSDERKHSLRHVKKRHSLRMASGGSSDTKQEEPATQVRKVSLRHKKAFEPSRQDLAFIAPAESISNPSTSPARTLRHERRPLSAGGRPSTSHSQTVALPPKAATAAQPRHVSLPIIMKDSQPHGLRRASKEQRLEKKTEAPVEPLQQVYELPPHSNLSVPGFSPSIKSHRFANTMTPMSGFSDRTEMELCEAKNVALFPHSNDSVLLINNGNIAVKKPLVSPQLAPKTFRPLSFTFENPEPSTSTSSESLNRSLSTPEIQLNGNLHAVDSPLTNPRAAPLPPAIQINPPTPSVEGDKQLMLQDEVIPGPGVQRRGSLLQTARRLSGSLLTPFALQRRNTYKQPSRPSTASGNDRLHPMWQPTSMWDDDDDFSDDDDYDDYDHHDGRLPAGGDTSDHPKQRARNGIFPRKMSVRMPGFRGTGGFLVGNSLGVERHGTNKRRHHVELPAKRTEHKHGLLSSIRQRVTARRAAKEEAAAEKRRADLKGSIGMRVVHHA